MAWHDLSQQAVERRCEVTMTVMVNGDGDDAGGDDDDDFDDGDGDNDGDDDHDDDHFNTGLRIAEAATRDASDAALYPAKLRQRIFQETIMKRLLSCCM